jgi:hypothetical protein
MVIADAIREAETEYVVYFLLDAYLNSNSRRAALSHLPAPISVLPLRGQNDTKARFILLESEFAAATKRRDDQTSGAIKEALRVFGAAVQRLQSLDMEGSSTATTRRASGECHDALPSAGAE